MLLLLVLPLLLMCASCLALGGKKTNQRKPQLGISFSDERILNRAASCPPECPSDCKDLYDKGHKKDGIYTIYISTDYNRPVVVYCDMKTSGGGWTVFQQRLNGDLDFYKRWNEYVNGFGDVSSEYWLGLRNLHYILAQKKYRLRIDLVDFKDRTAYAEYSYFTIGSPLYNFSLGINEYDSSSTANDSLTATSDAFNLNNMKFSTSDRGNDNSVGHNCSIGSHGAWWYNACSQSNLNGKYTTNETSTADSNIIWYAWNQNRPLKATEMKIRPM